MPQDEPLLSQILRFRPHPGPTPDPASLLQFFVEFERPEVKQRAFAAYLQLSLETYQAQVKFAQGLQASMGQRSA